MDSTTGPPFKKILIIGAGPSGLLLALLLAQRNIPSIVLEGYDYLDTRLRATQYGVPATRVFRRAGILEDIRAASIGSFPTIKWRRVSDKEVLTSIDMSCVKDHPDRMTILQLGEIIKIIYKHCLERAKGLIEIKFQHRLANIGQDEQRAWADVEVGEEKRHIRFEADYIVGCDGATSAVRKSLFGREWPGQTFDCQFIVQNVFYDGFEKYGWEGGNYMVDPDHWGLIAKRGKGGLWRVTYSDVGGLTDEEYLKRRAWHFEKILPGSPKPNQYHIKQTNMYKIHNRCADTFRVGRVLLAAYAAHVCNPMGGYGCMTAVLDVGGLADCFIGYYEGKVGEEILDRYAEVRRDIFLRYIDKRSIKNLERVAKSDPMTVLETDPFFAILKDLEGDEQRRREFLLKTSSIEYDFTKEYYSQNDRQAADAANEDQ
ncbi:hypothetical protein EG328_004626 [Venturia inaequalis]|uniref:FAD-binding domain-containing protein n=1 Tax=Venturia inaequalis TaxID=5025 RepID=A0A8H3UPU6_VENIN|nr:hypothetical protein EG328_004626 [Venturia inaequalis]